VFQGDIRESAGSIGLGQSKPDVHIFGSRHHIAAESVDFEVAVPRVDRVDGLPIGRR